MEYTQDTQLILNSLNKDRKELADKLGAIEGFDLIYTDDLIESY
ncbi:MAG TPA: hypothetical protein VK498_13305 [Ferruginibacter sp.]|nr:hypothetical protein [Ferruginibacter sp.]